MGEGLRNTSARHSSDSATQFHGCHRLGRIEALVPHALDPCRVSPEAPAHAGPSEPRAPPSVLGSPFSFEGPGADARFSR